jgi:hypothetical protein
MSGPDENIPFELPQRLMDMTVTLHRPGMGPINDNHDSFQIAINYGNGTNDRHKRVEAAELVKHIAANVGKRNYYQTSVNEVAHDGKITVGFRHVNGMNDENFFAKAVTDAMETTQEHFELKGEPKRWTKIAEQRGAAPATSGVKSY